MRNDNKLEEDLSVGFSQVLEKQLEKYFAFHGEDTIPPGLYARIWMRSKEAYSK